MARRLHLIIINNKKRELCKIVDFAVPADHRVKLKESEKKDKHLDLAGEQKKTMEHESDGDTNPNRCTRYCHQSIIKGTGKLGNNRTSGDHPNYCVIEIGQNTEKSSENLRRLAITQTPVKDHQLKLVWKTLKEENDN